MSVYQTSVDYILFTVLDQKLLHKLAAAYKKQVDKMFNEEEELAAKKLKIKIGKEFMIKSEEDIPENFNIDSYLDTNRVLIKKDLNKFLWLHNWTERQLCEYITSNHSFITPITKVVVY